MIIHGLILCIFAIVSVDCECIFSRNDTNSLQLQKNLKSWKVYGTILNASSSTSKYQIGICSEVNKSDGNAAITQKENDVTHVLGRSNSVNLIGGDNWAILTYDQGEQYVNVCDNRTRSASIIFVCGSNSHNITIPQEHTSKDIQCHYMFQIQVPEMCPSVPKEKKKLSGVGIFFIILLCLTSIYFIGGFLFMRIQRGARGLDQIPNIDLWRRVGQYFADGCDFCCRCRTGTRRAGYFMDETGPDLRGDDDILSP